MSEPTGLQRPDPPTVSDAYGLVAALRELRTWAGEPSTGQLTELAGRRELPDGRIVDALPGTTLSETVAGRRLPHLPSRAFVTAFVTACLRAGGCTDEQIAADVQRWRQILARVAEQEPVPPVMEAAGAGEPPEPRVSPTSVAIPVVEAVAERADPIAHEASEPAGPPEAGRRTKVLTAVAGVMVAVVVVVGVVIGTGADQPPRSEAAPAGEPARGATRPPVPDGSPPAGAPAAPQQTPSPATTSGSTPPAVAPTTRPGAPAAPSGGWYVVQPGHTRQLGYCWGEGRERNGRTDRALVVQRPCAEAVRTKLVPLGGGVYRLEWHSPQNGVGCVAVDYGNEGTGPGLLLAPRPCDYGGNRFRLEPRAGGHRLRPVHSGLCVGSLDGAGDTANGAEAMQNSCTGAADQSFVLTRRG